MDKSAKDVSAGTRDVILEVKDSKYIRRKKKILFMQREWSTLRDLFDS